MADGHPLVDEGRTVGAVDALASSRWASVAVVVVALVFFLPGFTTIGLMDGEEPGYVVAAREMAETGDFAGVRLQTSNSEWRARGAYWIEAAAISLAGPEAPLWVYRLPSLIAGVGAALAAWWLALAFLSRRGALFTGWFTAAAGVVGLHARLATPDALLLAATTLAAGGMARAWMGGARSRTFSAVLFWTGLGIAILAKGAVAPTMALVAAAILSIERGQTRWLGRLYPAAGLVWTFVIVSPWLILIALTLLQEPGGGPGESFLKLIGVPFALVAPPGSYLLFLPLLAGPVATFIFLAFRWLLDNLANRAVFFALAWGGPLWLAAELWPAKLPQVILPAIPAVVLLATAAIDAGACRIRGPISWFYSLGPVLWPPLGLAIVTYAFWRLEHAVPPLLVITLGVAAVLGPITWLSIRRAETATAVVLSMVGAAFIYAGFFGVFVPGLSGLRVAERLATLVSTAALCSNPAVAAAGYPEESLVFALGSGTRLVDSWGAADFLNSAGCRVALVDAGQISAFRHRADDLGLVLSDRGHVPGFNLRKMIRVDIHVFTVAEMARPTR